MEFSRQDYWSGLSFSTPGDLPDPGIECTSVSCIGFFSSAPPGIAAAAKSLQSCPTLCDPMDGSPPGSPSLGFSRQEHWSGLPFPSPMHESEYMFSHVQIFVTPWTVSHQAPLSMEFSKQEYWSELPFTPPGDLPNPGIESVSSVSLHCR